MEPSFRRDCDVPLAGERSARGAGSTTSQRSNRCPLPSSGERSDDCPNGGSPSRPYSRSFASTFAALLE
jgi:hypothetical protein